MQHMQRGRTYEYRDTANGRIFQGAKVKILDTPSLHDNADDEKAIGKVGTVDRIGQGAYVGLFYVVIDGLPGFYPFRGVEIEPIEA